MFKDRTDMRVRIAEQGNPKNQVPFTTKAMLVQGEPEDIPKKNKNHLIIVPDLMDTITTTRTVASQVSESYPPDWMQ